MAIRRGEMPVCCIGLSSPSKHSLRSVWERERPFEGRLFAPMRTRVLLSHASQSYLTDRERARAIAVGQVSAPTPSDSAIRHYIVGRRRRICKGQGGRTNQLAFGKEFTG